MTERCPCGWERPLIAITRANGDRPTDEFLRTLRLLYACPVCGRVHRLLEVAPPPEDTERFTRATEVPDA